MVRAGPPFGSYPAMPGCDGADPNILARRERFGRC